MLNILSSRLLGKAGAESDLLAEKRPAFGFLSAPSQEQRWKERNNFSFVLCPSFQSDRFTSSHRHPKNTGFSIMNGKAATVFQLPGEGTAGEAATVWPLLQSRDRHVCSAAGTCLSCKPHFNSRIVAFGGEGDKALERQVFVVYKPQRKISRSLARLTPAMRLISPPSQAARPPTPPQMPQ